MATFHISGSADWEVPEIGERLCQTFDQGKSKKLKRKLRPKGSREDKEGLLNKKRQKVESIKVPVSTKKRTNNGESTQKKKQKIKPLKNASNPQGINGKILKKRKEQLDQLKELIANKVVPKKVPNLRQKMLSKLKGARFRYLNEQMYGSTGREAAQLFREDPGAFEAYHAGYRLQVKKWPLNPLDKIIKSIGKMSKSLVVADFGCGDAKLSKSLEQTVHSFDLVASNELVVACDMSKVPLENSSVDIAVFCLSLMGTNLKDYLLEANRVLKKGGLLKVAEVESRFRDVQGFLRDCEAFGFKKTWMDLSRNLFYFIDFKKERDCVKERKRLPDVELLPCLYKKR
ncbi:uncharacterized protein LOC126747868 [Anthonomus grandis grandis]|uniref:uncharacterized protein LOC126747868 n=1 Tax=Anthonomus grandis grandis TaxID=2921223 RepID=UPI002165E81A|nr:uncharacterized protein LOC126747868 [Anthonomus grandis grandis]